ncbi:hypothetical protein Y1Q_0013758 [Alligator mississippiensis]|uniref:Uncharacterized protein n=1 Tax=Alligator mississippiensis TaxID=8496 RepID=A0A151MM44_ALLMI|nr:hypothetical protein Y1Q_0013758 [Alligator mississippiensis]
MGSELVVLGLPSVLISRGLYCDLAYLGARTSSLELVKRIVSQRRVKPNPTVWRTLNVLPSRCGFVLKQPCGSLSPACPGPPADAPVHPAACAGRDLPCLKI